jgi:hypothetical protein
VATAFSYFPDLKSSEFFATLEVRANIRLFCRQPNSFRGFSTGAEGMEIGSRDQNNPNIPIIFRRAIR